MTSTKPNQSTEDKLLDSATGRTANGDRQSSENSDPSTEPDDEPSLQDWAEAENSRPTLPDETADGLNDLDEEVRHQAEDLPLDTPGRI